MAQTITGISKTKNIIALDTYNHTTLTANMYTVSIDMAEQPPTGLSIVIQQNGVTKATSTAAGAAQTHVPLAVTINCAINDVLSVILSSSTPGDQGLNVIKGTLSIHVGSF